MDTKWNRVFQNKRYPAITWITLHFYDAVKNRRRLVRRCIFMFYPLELLFSMLYPAPSYAYYSFSFYSTHEMLFIPFFLSIFLALGLSCYKNPLDALLYAYGILGIIGISCFTLITSYGLDSMIFAFAWYDIILNSFDARKGKSSS